MNKNRSLLLLPSLESQVDFLKNIFYPIFETSITTITNETGIGTGTNETGTNETGTIENQKVNEDIRFKISNIIQKQFIPNLQKQNQNIQKIISYNIFSWNENYLGAKIKIPTYSFPISSLDQTVYKYLWEGFLNDSNYNNDVKHICSIHKIFSENLSQNTISQKSLTFYSENQVGKNTLKPPTFNFSINSKKSENNSANQQGGFIQKKKRKNKYLKKEKKGGFYWDQTSFLENLKQFDEMRKRQHQLIMEQIFSRNYIMSEENINILCFLFVKLFRWERIYFIQTYFSQTYFLHTEEENIQNQYYKSNKDAMENEKYNINYIYILYKQLEKNKGIDPMIRKKIYGQCTLSQVVLLRLLEILIQPKTPDFYIMNQKETAFSNLPYSQNMTKYRELNLIGNVLSVIEPTNQELMNNLNIQNYIMQKIGNSIIELDIISWWILYGSLNYIFGSLFSGIEMYGLNVSTFFQKQKENQKQKIENNEKAKEYLRRMEPYVIRN